MKNKIVLKWHHYRDNNEVAESSTLHEDSPCPRLASANELFEVVASGKVRVNVNQRFALKNGADAHKALEAHATSSSTILTI